MSAARTVIRDDEQAAIVVDSPAFEVVSIETTPTANSGGCIDIPLHLVPDVLTALMKAARCAAIDLPADLAAGYADARRAS